MPKFSSALPFSAVTATGTSCIDSTRLVAVTSMFSNFAAVSLSCAIIGDDANAATTAQLS